LNRGGDEPIDPCIELRAPEGDVSILDIPDHCRTRTRCSVMTRFKSLNTAS
jgi:hypothetical protein